VTLEELERELLIEQAQAILELGAPYGALDLATLVAK
jgi:hypothetical protein